MVTSIQFFISLRYNGSTATYLWPDGSVRTGFIYFHHYQKYEKAYKTCRVNNLRLLRVNSEAERQEVMRFTEGVKDFEVTSKKFYISLRYNVSAATYLWPDGTANSLTTNWLPGQPMLPATDQCVVQYSGKTSKHGQWESVDCTRGSPFICESGHSADPDLWTGGLNEVSFRSYLKTDSAMLNTYDAAQAADVSYFRHEISDFVIYKGFKEELVEVCALRCMSDSLCLGMTYTHNSGPQTNFCILLKTEP